MFRGSTNADVARMREATARRDFDRGAIVIPDIEAWTRERRTTRSKGSEDRSETMLLSFEIGCWI